MACACCGSASLLPKYRINAYRIVQCPECRVVQLDHQLSFQDVKQFYASGYFSGEGEVGYFDYPLMAPALQKNFSTRAADLAARLGGHGRVLEIGAGFGFFIQACRTLGLEAEGLEPSQEAVAWAQQSLGITLHHTTLEEFPVGPPVDAVAAWDVIEHIRDPNVFLSSVTKRLRPGGWLALTTGDIDSWVARLSGKRWHLFNLPEHLFFYSPRTLTALLARHGLTVTSITYPWNYYTAAYVLERLLKKSVGSIPPRLGTLLGHHSVLQRQLVPVNLWDIMQVHAQKA